MILYSDSVANKLAAMCKFILSAVIVIKVLIGSARMLGDAKHSTNLLCQHAEYGFAWIRILGFLSVCSDSMTLTFPSY